MTSPHVSTFHREPNIPSIQARSDLPLNDIAISPFSASLVEKSEYYLRQHLVSRPGLRTSPLTGHSSVCRWGHAEVGGVVWQRMMTRHTSSRIFSPKRSRSSHDLEGSPVREAWVVLPGSGDSRAGLQPEELYDGGL
ncbi:uncharacterized protein N7443_005680 [Penicillium atrosanguineum]|uniref:uncharacterized protein n=1 Tax=Penicillium atrosanguineum TaxID=1132637 RepID=UPI00238FDE3D|nr:uncharacterized protein N7443_005680 [Penicillium atrosanguineum]KAJ5300678.1 hypothetical protein N7443_005680 [Penicillium atrosanguineum]